MRLSNRSLILIILAALLLAAALFAGLWLTRPGGTTVLVTVDGEVYGTYDLHRDRTVTIQPKDGSWYNTLQIRNGRAAIIESDCSNQICVHTPALTEDILGIIVCLPHGVAVELR